jgi:hypothetical protein
MRAEDFRQRQIELEGWAVNLTSYRIGPIFYCTADNVSPGGAIARTTATTREEAEAAAIDRARVKLAATRRHSA